MRTDSGVVDNLNIKGFVNNSKALKAEKYQNLKTQCYYKYAERLRSCNCTYSGRIIKANKERL